jgi:hypothetical protein
MGFLGDEEEMKLSYVSEPQRINEELAVHSTPAW